MCRRPYGTKLPPDFDYQGRHEPGRRTLRKLEREFREGQRSRVVEIDGRRFHLKVKHGKRIVEEV